jgi:hypothetical protein
VKRIIEILELSKFEVDDSPIDEVIRLEIDREGIEEEYE